MTDGARRELLEWGKALVVAVVLALAIRTFLLQPYRVEGTSMVPTLHDGERLFLNRIVYRLHPPKRGDVVVIPLPDEGISIVKRIIGLPGDAVEIKNGSVWIDGTQLVEPYLAGPTLGNFGPVQVPEGRVFVLGDNRQASRDSRYSSVGFIEYARVKGKALLVYWPISALRTIAR
jgi:signal peptidase I